VIGATAKGIKVRSMLQRTFFFDSDHSAADLKIPMLIVGINEQVVRRLARFFGRANRLVSFCGFGFLCG
jgi:hypothetical protein